MFKKIIITLFLFFFSFSFSFATQPEINWEWLPGYVSWTNSGNIWIEVLSSIIWQIIQLVAAVAVIALIISWIMYMISWWEDEKVKKAKTWIIWSLVWVILSISAWWIINMISKITIS